METTFYDDGGNLIVEVGLTNDTRSTLYAFSTPRNIQYDITTRTLKILLSDRLSIDRPGHFHLPRFVAVEGGGETVVTLRLPRFLARLAPGKNMAAPQIERLPIHEATSIQVEMDWSDTQFSPDPRVQKSARQQLVDWAKSTLVAQARRREPPTPSHPYSRS